MNYSSFVPSSSMTSKLKHSEESLTMNYSSFVPSSSMTTMLELLLIRNCKILIQKVSNGFMFIRIWVKLII